MLAGGALLTLVPMFLGGSTFGQALANLQPIGLFLLVVGAAREPGRRELR